MTSIVAMTFLAAFVGAAFEKTEDFAYGQGVGRTGQKVASISAAAGLDEAGLFEAGEDQLEKLLRNGLATSDLGDFDGMARRLAGEVEDRTQSVIAFYRDVQPILLLTAGRAESRIRLDHENSTR